MILYQLSRPFRLATAVRTAHRSPPCAHSMLFSPRHQCPRVLAGSYHIEQRVGAAIAATFWQARFPQVAEIILVPHVALFEATCTVVLDEKAECCRLRNVTRLDGLAPREDGSVAVYTHCECLHAGTYELALAQRNSAGGERVDRFTIAVVDPELPPRKGALALVRAAQLGR